MGVTLHLPDQVCFRVTRYCNARCGFCLAPPDGAHPPTELLAQRIDWLMARGVHCIHFCGGEPTIHPGLHQLLDHVRGRDGISRLTTNGIVLPEALVPALQRARTRVKVSLHGDRDRHDELVGRTAFDATTRHLRAYVAAGLPTAVHTTIVAGGEAALDEVADFCVAQRVKQLCVLPFIPRGSGRHTEARYGLTPAARAALHEAVRRKRHALSGRLDVRWLDFSTRPVHVVEADGRVVLEGASEALDRELAVIPGEPVARKRVPLRVV